MTPLGLWTMGTAPALWLRFPDVSLLPALAVSTLCLIFAMRAIGTVPSFGRTSASMNHP